MWDNTVAEFQEVLVTENLFFVHYYIEEIYISKLSLINSKRFRRWYITFEIVECLGFVYRPVL
jgi:hypothetical protein